MDSFFSLAHSQALAASQHQKLDARITAKIEPITPITDVQTNELFC